MAICQFHLIGGGIRLHTHPALYSCPRQLALPRSTGRTRVHAARDSESLGLRTTIARPVEVSAGVRPNLIPPRDLAVRQGLNGIRNSQWLFGFGLSDMKPLDVLEIDHFFLFKQCAPVRHHQQATYGSDALVLQKAGAIPAIPRCCPVSLKPYFSLDDPYRASGCLLQQLPRDASEKEFFQS